jgi:phospholipid/cholesterol/gamma-HCH transport system substrate-binding protein
METRAHHVLIGAFTLGVAALLMLFILWTGKRAVDREFVELEVVFTEAVTGLSVGGTVQYSGIKVGEVTRLYLDPTNPSYVIARARVGSATPLTVDTRARLAFTGLTGLAEIQLSGGTPDSPPLKPEPGREVRRIVAEESALQRLLSGGEDVVTTVNEALVRLNVLLSNDNIERVGRTLQNIEQVSAILAAKEDDIDQLFSEMAASGSAIRRALEQTEALILRLESVAANADRVLGEDTRELVASTRQTVDAIRRLSVSVDGVVAENRDAVAVFANQSLAQIAPALAELRALLRELTRVAERIDEDPAAFIGGRDRPQEFRPR